MTGSYCQYREGYGGSRSEGSWGFHSPRNFFDIKNTVYAAMKRNEVLINATLWVNLENHVQ